MIILVRLTIIFTILIMIDQILFIYNFDLVLQFNLYNR